MGGSGSAVGVTHGRAVRGPTSGPPAGGTARAHTSTGSAARERGTASGAGVRGRARACAEQWRARTCCAARRDVPISAPSSVESVTPSRSSAWRVQPRLTTEPIDTASMGTVSRIAPRTAACAPPLPAAAA
eukprot:23369-Prymnesium_polylepis.1